MELLINSSTIPIKDWKSLCAFQNTQVSSSSLSSSSESSSPFSSSSLSFECIDLITFLNKSDLESLLTMYNDSLVTDPSFAFASSVSSSISGSSFTSSSASSASSGSSKFVPELVVQVIWSIVFGLMILVAMIGNLTVIWIVTGHRKMRTVTNVFLLNLTIADLIMATFNGVFNFVYMLHSHWPFGKTYCIINNFIANVTVASSVFTITATSIDRYIAVVHPLKPRMTKHQVMLIIIMVWSLAALLSLPTLLYSELYTIPFQDGGYRMVCILVWPDGSSIEGKSKMDHLYNLTFLTITYVIPMISLVITYSLMSRVLWGSKGIGEETDIQRESIRSKQKVARMLIALVVLFAICWLPYHAYFLLSYHFPHINQSVIIQHIYLFSYWMAMSNSMYNPLVYYWMNKRFRSYFASIFCFFSRNRLKKQLSYNVKTDLSSNGFQHGTTHYRRTPVQSSNQIELHQRNNLDNSDYPTCNNPSKGYPETKLNFNPSKQSNGYLLQQSSDSRSPLILNNVFRGVLINGNTINGDNSDNNNSTFNGQNNGHANGHANGNSLTNSQSIVHNNNNNNNNNNHNNQNDSNGANCECNSLLSC